GKQMFALRGHSAPVQYGAFSPDGSRVVTASRDATVRLWDLRTQRMISVLRGHTADVAMAEFADAGKSVISVSEDGTARYWDVDYPPPPSTSELRERVCHEQFVGALAFTDQEREDPLIRSRPSLFVPCSRLNFLGLESLLASD